MSLPTPYALTVREPTSGAPDEFGNVTQTWAERTWRVHGIAPGGMNEPDQPNRDLSLIAFTIYGPKVDAPTSERAEVRVDGEWFTIEGRPKDWTRGPWPHPTAGVVVELRRAEG